MERKYNIIVFGATGFTGKYLVEEIVNLQKQDKTKNFTWAVSGRSDQKLDEILNEVSVNTGVSLNDVPRIICDVSESSDSLRRMAKQGDVILNCVGPYTLYGEVVVRACLEEGTHHLDLSGETDYLESMQLKYNRIAEEEGVYIIAPCGFDSIPADLGTTYLQQQFGGELNSVDIYMQFYTGGKPTKINHGTWHSGMIMASKVFQLNALDKQLHPDPLPTPKYKLSQRLFHYVDTGKPSAKGWFFPNPLIDQRVVYRSQRYFYHQENRRPLQVNVYFGERNFFVSLIMMIGVLLIGLFAQLSFGRNLLIKYPEIFSLGTFSRKGPTREEMDRTQFTFTLIGKGWAEKSTGDYTGNETHTQPPNKTKILRVKGRNPGYGATNEIFLNCALVLLEQKNKLPRRGGVFTPGVAFANTDLVDRLNKKGVTFTLDD